MMLLVTRAPLTDFGDWSRSNGLEIVMLATGAVLLARFVRWFSAGAARRAEERRLSAGSVLVRSEESKHLRALGQVVSWAAIVLIYVVAGILIVERFGIALAAFIPVATVAGVAFGFGAQRIVGDLLAGFFLVAERQYGFGDLIRISVVGLGTPVLGTVENVSLRVTTVRTPSGEVVITPNGQIAQITNLSRDWARAVIDVPVPLSVEVNRVTDVLRRAGEEAYADPALRNLLLDAPAVMGVEEIGVDQFKVRVVARTLPGKQFEVGRSLRGRITSTLHAEGINAQAEVSTGAPTGTA